MCWECGWWNSVGLWFSCLPGVLENLEVSESDPNHLVPTASASFCGAEPRSQFTPGGVCVKRESASGEGGPCFREREGLFQFDNLLTLEVQKGAGFFFDCFSPVRGGSLGPQSRSCMGAHIVSTRCAPTVLAGKGPCVLPAYDRVLRQHCDSVPVDLFYLCSRNLRADPGDQKIHFYPKHKNVNISIFSNTVSPQGLVPLTPIPI